ncbi:9146_t:CDS:2 [Acaulospora colombiana]|uniref:9146_t:CDS:1 n=1 Tax=Acaulospora colombiana TaxID=27376 RepID=A0ACA9MP36_9GLOM|nr:9146_t:CDS:2 [Acaulospora colombiana]
MAFLSPVLPSPALSPSLPANLIGNPSVDSDITRTATGPGLRLIRFEDGATPIPITPEEKIELEKSGLRYFDVTEVDVEAVFHESIRAGKSGVATKSIPTSPSKQDKVKPVIATLSQDNLKADLAALIKYKTRYYKSTTGATAANDLLTKLKSIASSASGSGGAVTVSAFSHTWGQTTSGPITIVGAHLDSINQADPVNGNSPGADDNGKIWMCQPHRGIPQVGRRWIQAFQPSRIPLGGLLGSAKVSAAYKQQGKAINAYMNLGMRASIVLRLDNSLIICNRHDRMAPDWNYPPNRFRQVRHSVLSPASSNIVTTGTAPILPSPPLARSLFLLIVSSLVPFSES